MTPPDSGEREVRGAVIVRVNAAPLRCEKARGHDGAHEAKLAGPIAAHGRVMIPRILAQRILAFVEWEAGKRNARPELRILASELRARVTR